MALGHFGPQGVRFSSGAPARDFPIRVETESGILISLFNDPDGLDPAPNPKPTDPYGNLFFYTTPGEYVLEYGTARIPIIVEELETGAGGSEVYTHLEPSPAAVWNVTHNLGMYREPVIFLDDNPTVPVWTDLVFPDNNHTTIIFDAPVSGRAEFA